VTPRHADDQPDNPLPEIVSLFIGLTLFGAAWYATLAALRSIVPWPGIAQFLGLIQWLGVALLALIGAWGVRDEFRKTQSRRATHQVAEALHRIQAESGGDVTRISSERVAASVKVTNVSDEQVRRLVDQRKQQLLIDDEAFRAEVSGLIVEYLQPLPRNAKRILNRFRVNLLIADRRRLFTTDPKITRQQIGKWLVLGERWPQMRRVLAANPSYMLRLEATAEDAADGFMKVIQELAPPYDGDQDLRNLVRASPPLASILPRLLYYGADTPPAERGTAPTSASRT